jgi:hypothetical protein
MKRSFSEKDAEEIVEDEEKHLSMKRCVISNISTAIWKSRTARLPELAAPA